VETIEDQRDQVLCPGCSGDKPQIGESYRRAEVGNSDVLRLEIQNGFVLLVVDDHVEVDLVHRFGAVWALADVARSATISNANIDGMIAAR